MLVESMKMLVEASEGIDCQTLLLELAERNGGEAEPILEIVRAIQRQMVRLKECNCSKKNETLKPKEETVIERRAAVFSISAQSFQQPRGSFEIDLSDDDALSLVNKAGVVKHFIPRDNLIMSVLLQVPRQAPRLLLELCQPLTVGKSKCAHLLLTPTATPKYKELFAKVGDETISGLPFDVCKRLLSSMQKPLEVYETSTDFFKTSSGGVALKCYYSINDGLLFPVKQGLIFIQKPTLFLRRQEIQHVEIDRNMSAGARNFDAKIFMKSGETHEFSMIERDEYEALLSYLERMGIGGIAEKGCDESGENVELEADDETDSDDSEDSDYEMNSSKSQKPIYKDSLNPNDESESSHSSASESDRESDIDVGDMTLPESGDDNEESETEDPHCEVRSSIVESMKKRRRISAAKGTVINDRMKESNGSESKDDTGTESDNELP